MTYPKITKRKDGRYQAKVPIGKNPETNQTVRKTVYGKTKTEVKRKIEDIQKSVIKGDLLPTMRSNFTVRQWCDEYLELYASHLSKGTYKRYSEMISHYIDAYLGNIELSKLNALHCQHFVNYLIERTELHVNTINYIVSCLKLVLNKACVLGFLGKNPAENITVPKKEKPQLNTLSEEKAIELIEVCSDNTLDNLCKFAIFSGLRVSEIMALTWKDIEGNEMIVSHQFARDKTDTHFYPTKNKKSRRVKLSKKALTVLESQRHNQAELQITSGDKYRNNLGLVFTDKKGDRLHINMIRRRFNKLCAEIGCYNIRFHDLRHTYAVLSIKAGVDIKTISESLGHHSVSFTLDQYAYVTDQMREDAANKLDNYLNQYMN